MRTLCTLLLAGSLDVFAQSPCLIASYPFDGNALDTTGNEHDGVVFGAADAIGHDGGGCYHFDGVDDFIKLGGIWGGLNGTITAWINPDALTQYNPVFSRRDTTVNGSALELVVNINAQPDSSKLYKGTDFPNVPVAAICTSGTLRSRYKRERGPAWR